jgi:hypothetical protein
MFKKNNLVFFLNVGFLLLLICNVLCPCAYAQDSGKDPRFPPLRILGDKLYAGDEELFLNAIGYSGIRPGKDSFDPLKDAQYGYELIDLDMQRIKEIGFNVVRTYALLDEQLVALAMKHGLWVVGGIWTDPGILPYNDSQVQKAVDSIKEHAKLYAKYPNVAMLLLVNEPQPSRMFGPATNRYMKRLVEAAKENCPGVPVSFSNMPNAVFMDPSVWDVISYNIYAAGFSKFTGSIGYRGLVEGVKKLGSAGKPFFISEYGFYAPVPKPQLNEPWIFLSVRDEEEQAVKLLRDRDTLSQLGLAGMTLMTWDDDWRNFSEVPSAQAYLEEPARSKYIHDMFTQEWGGINAYDDDIKGRPRKAYYALEKVNQALCVQPDTQVVYERKVPVRLYITEQVARLRYSVDGKEMGEIPRVSTHWAEINLSKAVIKDFKSLKEHSLRVVAFDSARRQISEVTRNFWTGRGVLSPVVKFVGAEKSPAKPKFTVELKYSDGRPIPDARVSWGLFDVFNWKDYGGEIITDKEGKASFFAPQEGKYLAGAGYEFNYKKFTKRYTDLIFVK